MNYRLFYQQETAKRINTYFEIHHIDFDRKNNDILNLVALPKELHEEYHLLKNIAEGLTVTPKLKGTRNMGYANNTVTLHHIKLFVECYEKCIKWVDYRDYLLGYIPNIHNLSY